MYWSHEYSKHTSQFRVLIVFGAVNGLVYLAVQILRWKISLSQR